MKKPHKSSVAYRLRQMGQPHALRYIHHHTAHVMGQQKFLDAQNAYQDSVNRARERSMRGNPYLQ